MIFITVHLQLELIACANPKDRITLEPLEDKVDTILLAAERLLRWGCQCIVATRGSEGASVFTLSESDPTEIIEESEPAIKLKVSPPI